MYDKKDYKWYLRYKNAISSNLIDPSEVRQGFYATHTGRVSPGAQYACSEAIPVQPGVWYDGWSNRQDEGLTAWRFVAFMDLDMQIVSSAGGENMGLFQAPEGAFFVRVTFGSSEYGQDPAEVCLAPRVNFENPAMFTYYYFSRLVTPIYKKLSREFKKEDNEAYYREYLDGNFKLVRKDYEFLDSAHIEDKIKVQIVDETGKLNDYHGFFYKTDCKWDGDNKIVEVKVDPDDDYAEIIGGKDKTFNLIDLAPEREAILLKRRPVIQLYGLGDSVITNVSGSMYREEQLAIDPVVFASDMDQYHFFEAKNEYVINPSYFSMGLISTDVSGVYEQAVRQDGVYVMNSRGFASLGAMYYEIARASDGAVLYATDINYKKEPIQNLLFRGDLGETGDTGEFYMTNVQIFARILYSQPFITRDGAPVQTFTRPENDITEANPNYPFCMPFETINVFWYDGIQEAPTKFGRIPEGLPGEGQYYKEYLATDYNYPLPISPSHWKDLSVWYFNGVLEKYTEYLDAEEITFRDAYPLSNVLNSLLRAVGSSVTYGDSTTNSEILYSINNPLGAFSYMDFDNYVLNQGNDASVGNIELFITPKSNVLGDYDEAARKAEITLTRVLKMLRDTFKIYWHVENKKLRLEHISWYQRGGSYTEPVIGADLTELLQLRNEKKWGFAQNKWDYDKEKMPERFEYGWMDDVTEAFDGFPIQVRSKFVQQGNIEQRVVEGFTTDYDYITINPGAVSKDGFCLLATVWHNGAHRVPFVEFDMGINKKVVLQNGLLAWVMLHLRYHVYDMPADKVTINNEDVELLENITKMKKQEVVFPGMVIDPYKLVKTMLGNGIIEEMKIDMGSYIARATIKHDTQL